MITLEKVERSWNSYKVPEADWDKLVNYYASQIVPFEGTSGKYCIHSSITYPRYKIKASFEKYNSGKINKRSIAKNESYADYISIPVKEIKSILFDVNSHHEAGVNYKMWRHYGKGVLSRLTTLIKMFNDYPNAKLIDFHEVAKTLDSVKERLVISKSQFIIDLLNSGDKGSEKLGMELITNFDTEKSLPAIFYVLSESNSQYTLKHNDYFTSTAFRAFRERFRQLTSEYVESAGTWGHVKSYEKLIGLKVGVTDKEHDFYRDELFKRMIQIAEDKNVTLNINPEHVILRFETVIPESEVEEADMIMEQAAMEDDGATYIIVDDTTESA